MKARDPSSYRAQRRNQWKKRRRADKALARAAKALKITVPLRPEAALVPTHPAASAASASSNPKGPQ